MAPREDGLARTNLKESESKDIKQEVEPNEVVEVIEQEKIQDEEFDERIWQTDCRGVVDRLGMILTIGFWPDCDLAIGAQEEIVRAHRLILASASPVFSKMLYNPTNFYLVLRNIEVEPFKVLLKYIYTDNVNITNFEIGCSLYEAAHFLIMPNLEIKCKTYLLNNISPVNVLELYEFSEKYDVTEIKTRCLEVMVDKAGEILASGGIEAARIETLETMFALSELNINSEVELVKAAERWVRAKTEAESQITDKNRGNMLGRVFSFPKLNLNAEFKLLKAVEQWIRTRFSFKPVDEDIDDDIFTITKERSNEENNAKSIILKVLKHIRFLTITPEEFAEYDMTFLLGKSVLVAIMLNLNAKVVPAYVHMPKGFSTSREKRRRHIEKVCTEKENDKESFMPSKVCTEKENDKESFTPSKDLQTQNDNVHVFSTQMEININQFDSFASETFSFKLDSLKVELDWYFNLHKYNYDDVENTHHNCQFRLGCVSKEIERSNEVVVFDSTVQIFLIRQGLPGFRWSGQYIFEASEDGEPFYKHCLVDWDEILNPDNGYVVDNKLTIGLKVNIQSPHFEINMDWS